MASPRPRSSSLPTLPDHFPTWPYEYSPLLSPRAIRLLFIESQDPTRHCVTGRLEVVSLEDFERRYVALSYTWGPAIREGYPATEDPSRKIPSYELLVAAYPTKLSSDDCDLHHKLKTRLNKSGGNTSIKLTPNLSDYFTYHAEWHIKEEMPLWVDAICINQQDPAEVADQILLQADIYTMAIQTNVWLGACSKELSTFEWWQDTVYQALIGKRKRQRESPYVLDLMFKTGDHLDAQFWHENFGLIPPNGLSWHDCWRSYVDFFFARRWFSRLWTIQEVMLAQKVYMFCGPRYFNFSHVLHLDRWLLSSFFRAKPSHETKGSETEPIWPRWNPGYIFEIIRTRINHVQLGPSPPDTNDEVSTLRLSYLLGVLQCARGQETTYARDKVLGLLGVATRFVPKNKVQLLVRDLGGSDRDVFISFARYYIHRQCLDILSYAGHRHGSAHSSWPSWVPNWDDVSQSGFYEFPSPANEPSTALRPVQVSDESQSERLSTCIPRVLSETLLLYGVRIGVIKEAYAKDDWTRHFRSFLTLLGSRYCLTGETIEQALLGTIFRTSADEPSATQRSGMGDMDQFLLYIRTKLVHNAQVDSNFTEALESLLLPQSFLLPKLPLSSRIFKAIQGALSEIEMLKGGQAIAHSPTDRNLEVLMQQTGTLRRSFSMEVEVMQKIFNIFITDEGVLGNGSKSIKPKDEIWVVKNGSVPLILERDVDGQKFRLVSTAYVHGVKYEEVFRDKRAEDMVELKVI